MRSRKASTFIGEFILESEATAKLARSLAVDETYASGLVLRLLTWLKARGTRYFNADDDRLVYRLKLPATYSARLIVSHLVDSGWCRQLVARDGRAYFEMVPGEQLFPEIKRREQERLRAQRYRDKKSGKKAAKVIAIQPNVGQAYPPELEREG